MIIGDFNSVTSAHEKSGGCTPLRISCEDFNEMIDFCNLVDIQTSGSPFTWSNGWRSRG